MGNFHYSLFVNEENTFIISYASVAFYFEISGNRILNNAGLRGDPWGTPPFIVFRCFFSKLWLFSPSNVRRT